MKNILFYSILILIILLSGCLTVVSSNGNLQLTSGEKWTLDLNFQIPAEEVLINGIAISQSLNQMVQKGTKIGVEVNWEQNGPNNLGNITYIIKMSGKNYDQLNEQFDGSFRVENQEFDGKPAVHIIITPYLGVPSRNSTFSLSGGNVISTNGQKIDGNTIKWTNSNYMEATMEPPRFFWICLPPGFYWCIADSICDWKSGWLVPIYSTTSKSIPEILSTTNGNNSYSTDQDK